MNDEFCVQKSLKAQINSQEHYIVTIGSFVYLRVLGNGSKYEVMTATAGEDDKRFLALGNQDELIKAARNTAEALGGQSLMCQDNYGRNYVKICRIENNEDLDSVLEIF